GTVDVLHEQVAANGAPSHFVIPAPLASEASKRESAGTHAPGNLLLDRTTRATVPRGTGTNARVCSQVHGPRPFPARAFQALAAPG
ncbi:MAG TPA: hypothetical protein VH913_02130, partial [Hyphomicrobiaceae bacterium]